MVRQRNEQGHTPAWRRARNQRKRASRKLRGRK